MASSPSSPDVARVDAARRERARQNAAREEAALRDSVQEPGLGPSRAPVRSAQDTRGWSRLWYGGLALRLPLAAAAGLLTDLAFAPFDVWLAAPAGVVLLIISAWGLGPGRSWLCGFAWGLAFFLPHLHFTLVSSGTAVAWVALSVLQAAIQATALPLMTFACRAPGIVSGHSQAAVGRALVMAASWVAVEQLRAVWPFSGLPWGILAFSQNSGPFIGLAPYGGTILVSGAVVMAAALVVEALAAAFQGSQQWPHVLADPRPGIGQYAMPVPTALALGALSLVTVAVPAVLAPMGLPQVGHLRAVIAQGDVPTAGGSWRENALGVVQNHALATEEALADARGRIDVVLWPESASDLDPRVFPEIGAIVDRVARDADAPVLLGTQQFRPSLDHPVDRLNEYVTWVPGQGAVAAYAKQRPVAFGEYMPMRDLLRTVTDAVDLVGTDMVAGTEPGLVTIPGAGTGSVDVPVAVGICFEVAYDRIIRESVVDGGQVIVIPTNNASFGYSREAVQQLAMSRFRAVEHSRTVVQVSTTGVSAVINPNGSILWDTGMWERASTVASLPRITELTVSDRLGDVPLVLVVLLAGSSAVAGAVTTALMRRNGRRRTAPVVLDDASAPERKETP